MFTVSVLGPVEELLVLHFIQKANHGVNVTDQDVNYTLKQSTTLYYQLRKLLPMRKIETHGSVTSGLVFGFGYDFAKWRGNHVFSKSLKKIAIELKGI